VKEFESPRSSDPLTWSLAVGPLGTNAALLSQNFRKETKLMRSSSLFILAFVALNSPAFAGEHFQPAYSSDQSLSAHSVADTLGDEDYQFRHVLDAQTTRKDLALAKAKSGILQKELERAKILVNGPSFSKEGLAFKEWEYRESVAEIARLEGSVKFHIALANVYKLRVQKGADLTSADFKLETGYRIEGYEAKLASVVVSLETVRYLKKVTGIKEQSGHQLLKSGSITQADLDKRAYYAAGAREQEEILVEQIDSIQKLIANLKKTQNRL
jgi:hypothetical protein